jgi:4-diphosphocytidyl-2-C-methyl-D-erythritol kinase
MRRREAHAKINLALLVGPLRDDGKHEVVTVLQRVDLADVIELSVGNGLAVSGFDGDTIVAAALTALGVAAGVEPHWSVHITKRIPVSAGLGGGSSDAATALLLANESLESPLDLERLSEIAAAIGADVPFFLRDGPQLGTGDGSHLAGIDLPQDFTVVLVLPDDVRKESTATVYAAFDGRRGALGFEERRATFTAALAATARAEDFAALPANDLAASPLADRLRSAGAVRADVSGAGPCVYGVFIDALQAGAAGRELESFGRTWVVAPRR